MRFLRQLPIIILFFLFVFPFALPAQAKVTSFAVVESSASWPQSAFPFPMLSWLRVEAGAASSAAPSRTETLHIFEHHVQCFFLILLFTAVGVALERLRIRKRFEKDIHILGTNQERAQAIITEAPVGIFTSSYEGKIIAANREFCQLFGYDSPDEMTTLRDVGRELYRDPNDRQKILALLSEEEGRVINREVEFVRRDGVTWWGNLSVQKNQNPEGKVVLQGFLQDISEYKSALQTIRESQSFLEMALEVADAGTWSFICATGEYYLSPNCYRVLGHETDRVSLDIRTVVEMIHPDDKWHFIGLRSEVERPNGKDSWELQCRLLNKRGVYQWLLFKGQVSVRDENGLPVMIVGVIFDIQKFKDAEQRLKFEAQAKEDAKKRLEYEAYHDPLTSLGNRAQCMKDIASFPGCKKKGDHLCLIFFDIVNFGQVNQGYGHPTGDELLQAISINLLHIVGTSAHTYRVGGDQFAVIKCCDSEEDCVRFGQHVRDRLLTVYFIRGEKLEISFVFGLGYSDKRDEKADHILNMAVLAHSEAKRVRDGRLVVYDMDIHAKETRRLTLGKIIKTSLVNGEFYLEYQPLINSRTGRLHGCEALLRWNSSQLGRISPGEFIPIAEDTGQIGLLGEWALEQAFSFWTASGLTRKGLVLAINVSGHQFSQQGFGSQMETLLERTRIDPKTVELEVTETALMKNARESVRKLEHLRALGVRISIDDFGTGYSSLDYLHQLDADTLKIDLNFVQKLERDDKSQELVRAMINLARIFDMDVVGEGVETESQKAILCNLTCNYLQGFLFSRPVSEEHLPALFDKKFF